jgi:hypothetical protein
MPPEYPYLECKMLQEVCSAIVSRILSPASSINPNTNGRGLSPWGVLSSDL